jgi:flagellar biosynthetic protein FliQ
MIIEIMRDSLTTAFMLAAPMLVAGLIVGVVVGILQAVTSIQEITLTFIPKIVAVVAVLLYSLPWLMTKMHDFTHGLYVDVIRQVH